MQGALIVISGPSGVGKGSVIKEILQSDKNYKVSISATTRSPRIGEINKKDYYFLTNKEFENKIANNEMLEYELYDGNFYGTPRKYVETNLKAGFNVILEIDVKGALCLKEKLKKTYLFFLKPPSMEELRKRLSNRNTETKQRIDQRMKIASWEMQKETCFDMVLINFDIKLTAQKIMFIVKNNLTKR